MAKEKDTKRILQTVEFWDRKYGPGDEDALEARLTKERATQLLEDDPPSLAGEWNPTGKAESAMPGSKLAGGDDKQAGELAKLQAENDRLKAELRAAKEHPKK